MGAIDIGLEAIGRSATIDIATNTIVGKDNPANGTGTITDVDIWLSASVTPDVWIGTFSAVGNVLTCHDSESVGDVASGSKQTLSGLDIDVVAGDYLGMFAKSGLASVERDTTGFGDAWFFAGEVIDPTDSQTFTLLPDDGISLFGTGTSPVVVGSKSANMAAKMMAAGLI